MQHAPGEQQQIHWSSDPQRLTGLYERFNSPSAAPSTRPPSTPYDELRRAMRLDTSPAPLYCLDESVHDLRDTRSASRRSSATMLNARTSKRSPRCRLSPRAPHPTRQSNETSSSLASSIISWRSSMLSLANNTEAED
ncbi:hypothetical protein KFE25_008599 [Diacronema lutheri]|uniref:Uncharacterized protein n=1 Tax=Diacronema lutheri TaxID=2081491 RepID=A0A8J5XL97_DIALT|nr:hypothetical protein KFE25_008599 [Diacronema lutheri]